MSATYRVQNPVDDSVVQTFNHSSDAEIQAVLHTADSTVAYWGNASFAERAEVLNKAAELLEERAEGLAAIIAEEMGKNVDDGVGEVKYSAQILRYYAQHAEEHCKDKPIEVKGGSAVLRTLPQGVLLGIMPWNFPYYQVARFAGPNLAVGNTILLKHAEICPRSSAAFEQIFADAGAPAGVFTNIYATHDQVADIIADPRVRGVSLTGSERAGSAVASQAGAALTKCVLELGGTDAYIVLDSDDVAKSAAKAWAKRNANTGQACTSNKRIIVAGDIYDEFVDEMVAIAEKMTPGNPAEGRGENKYFPLSSRDAAERLEEQVKRAVKAGAKLHVGGELGEGAYFSPAVLTDVPRGSESFYEEFFGPVAEIYRADSEEEAIELANDSRYGLGGAVFSTDTERAKKVAAQIDTGMVHVNLAQASGPQLPFGGVKNSGFGRELSVLAMDEFVNRQTYYVHGQ